MRIIACDVDNKQSSSFKLHRQNGRNDYLFVLFKSPARVMVNGEYIPCGKGSFIIFDKHKAQSYFAAEGQEFLHDFMHFDTENNYEQLIFSGVPTDTLLFSPVPDLISNILTQIKNEFIDTPTGYRHEILTNLGTAFLYRIKNEIEKSNSHNIAGTYFSEFYSLRMRIYKAPNLDWTVAKMSCELNLSRSYFQSLYKKLFGISSCEDVINARISYAKILLTSTLHTVGQIAEECGYSSTEHFIRQFKIKTGMSPKKFRNT